MFNKLIQKVKNVFNSIFTVEDALVTDPVQDDLFTNVTARKRHDCTKLTQYHYDFIRREYLLWKEANTGIPRKEKETRDEFVQRLNARMGLNKSYRTLNNVWSGRIKRDDLPQGTPSFDF